MTRRTTLLFATALLVLGGMAGLSGCSAVDGMLHKESTHTFEDVDAFAAGGAVHAEWVPDDATQITVRTSTLKDAEDAVILLRSSTGSLPGDCLEVSRTSAPTWALDGAPSAYDAKNVFVCGDWSVIPADGGWLGWTPNSDEGKEAASN